MGSRSITATSMLPGVLACATTCFGTWQMFVGNAFGPAVRQIGGWVVSVVFGGLLLSAVNTAIVDLIAISFLMSRDRELPRNFEKLNSFGVPNLGLLVATVMPMILVVAV